MSPTATSPSSDKKVHQDVSKNVLDAANPLVSGGKPAPGAIRRNRKQSKQLGASGRSHEENQERAYIAASRRSDRSIEARLESARRASEIHKKRCGRGLKVTEEAVMNEEMYEEEDPDYELRVNRLRMLMNYPSMGYHPYQWPMLPYNNGSDGGNSTPTTPSATPFPNQQLTGSPTNGFMFANPFAMPRSGSLTQIPMSPLSPGAQHFPTQMSQMAQLQNTSVPTTPAPHFLPPTQFSPQIERQENPLSMSAIKPDEPIQVEIPEHDVVLDQAPLDLTLNFDSLGDFNGRSWDNSDTFNMEEWVSHGGL